METIKSISSYVSACNAWKPDDTAGFATLLNWAPTCAFWSTASSWD